MGDLLLLVPQQQLLQWHRDNLKANLHHYSSVFEFASLLGGLQTAAEAALLLTKASGVHILFNCRVPTGLDSPKVRMHALLLQLLLFLLLLLVVFSARVSSRCRSAWHWGCCCCCCCCMCCCSSAVAAASAAAVLRLLLQMQQAHPQQLPNLLLLLLLLHLRFCLALQVRRRPHGVCL